MDEQEIRALFPVGTSLPEIDYDDTTKEWYLYWWVSPKTAMYVTIQNNGVVIWSEIQDGKAMSGQCELEGINKIVKSFYLKGDEHGK